MSATSDLIAYKDETIAGLEKALEAAVHALRSYEHDNASTELAQAAHLAQKLQKQIQVDPISPGPQGEPANVTVSVGIATTIPASGVDHRMLFSRADKLLYQAKLEGRNRIRASRF